MAGYSGAIQVGRPAVGWAVYDEFNRADQGGAAQHDIGSEAGGKRWQTSGGVLPRIQGRRLRSGGYTYLDLKRQPRTQVAMVGFDVGVNVNAFGIISCDVFNIPTWNAIHNVYLPHYVSVQVYEAGVMRLIANFIYATPMRKDGSLYRIAQTVVGNDLIMDLPDGTTQVFTDAAFGAFQRAILVWQNNNIAPGNAEASFGFAGALR